MTTYTIQFDGERHPDTIEASSNESAWLAFSAWVRSIEDELETIGMLTLHTPDGEQIAAHMVY